MLVITKGLYPNTYFYSVTSHTILVTALTVLLLLLQLISAIPILYSQGR